MTFCSRQRERLNRRPHAGTYLELLVGGVRGVWFRRHKRGRQAALVEVLARGERRCRFDRVDANDRSTQTFFVGANPGGQIGHRWFVPELSSQRLTRCVQFSSLTPDPTRPRIAAKGIDHGTTNASLRKCFELDAAILVEATSCVDEAQYSVLHEIANVDGVRHGRSHPPGECLNER